MKYEAKVTLEGKGYKGVLSEWGAEKETVEGGFGDVMEKDVS